MLLGDEQIESLIIRDPREIEEAKGQWERREWGRIGEKILIDPFHTSNVNPISYELSVGSEYISLRDPYTVRQLAAGGTVTLAPNETILILSEEYVALPRTIAGFLVPRGENSLKGPVCRPHASTQHGPESSKSVSQTCPNIRPVSNEVKSSATLFL